MSDPIKKLEAACDLIGEECNELVKKRKDKQIGDLTFVNEFFRLLDKMPDENRRKAVINDLEDYLKKHNKLADVSWLKK